MVTQTREKNAKIIPSLQEPPLLGSAITHSGAGRFDLYRRIARECGDIGLFLLGPYHVIQIVSSDLARLPFTFQVFKETMRLYPPAYILSRTALHNTELCGYPIRKGDIIFVGIYAMHHRPDYFPDPETFRPERFAPEQEKNLPRSAYIPFGGGPRICIGNHFALMEAQLLLATLAQRATFELLPGQSLQLDPNKSLTMRTKNTIKMIVHRRPASKISCTERFTRE